MKIIRCQVFAFSLLASLPLYSFAQDYNNPSPNDAMSAKRHYRMAEKFKEADTDGNGLLSQDEMQKGMPRLAPHFDEIDIDHNGEVSPEELRAFMKARKSEEKPDQP